MENESDAMRFFQDYSGYLLGAVFATLLLLMWLLPLVAE